MTHTFLSTINLDEDTLTVEVSAEINVITYSPKDVRITSVREADSLDTRNIVNELTDETLNSLKFACIADYEGEEDLDTDDGDEDSDEDEEKQD